MKVAFDSQIFFFEKYGGISRYFSCIIKELILLGNNVKIFSKVHKNKYLHEYLSNSVAGIYLTKYPPKTARILKFTELALDYAHMCLWKPQIIHETFYSYKSYSPSNVPKVITIHDMTHEIYPEMFSSHDNTSERKRASVSRADHIICVSQNTKYDLIKYFNVPDTKISVIYHGFSSLQEIHQYEIDIIDYSFLLFVGKRAGYKNFKIFLKSVASDVNLKRDFKIIAFGGGPFCVEEIVLIRELGFSDKQVLFYDGNDQLLGYFFSKATAFIYPSLYEGFGLPILEAMYYNCPVIASNSSSIPEIAGMAAAYFDPNSVENMSYIINKIVYSSSLRAELIMKGLIQHKKYTWEKTAILTNNVYNRLL